MCVVLCVHTLLRTSNHVCACVCVQNVALIIVLVLLAIFLIWYVWKGVLIVKEREVVVVERWGQYNKTLSAGVHFVWPFVQAAKVCITNIYIHTHATHTHTATLSIKWC